MELVAEYAQHDRYQRSKSPQASQPQLLSFAYVEQMQSGAPATRTQSLRSPRPSSTPRYGSKSRFPISTARVSWKKLPPSILNLILDHLRYLHLSPGSSSCSTCYMRDLTSVQLTCKTWFSDAQRILYTNIQIIGQDDISMLRKWRVSRAARLIRLRSTLRSRPLLAALVRTLHVPDPHIPIYTASGSPNPEYDAYLCTIASLVMECPNLEALTGFVAFYNHTFDRLTHALSTRTKLRQHVWVIAENEDVSVRSQTQLPPGLLDAHQIYQFELYHRRWNCLETLMLCSPGSLGVIEHELFIRVLHSLPALRNLCISSFDADDFHDMTLLSLPPWVTTLRLEECSGVTDAGLMQWAASPNAAQIERLSLIHQNVTSLLTLSKIFASMGRLWKFTILQTDVVPSWPKEVGVLFQPVLASGSLRFLHWDILSRSPEALSDHHSYASEAGRHLPNMQLALSISHNGFPSLRQLRAPRDISPPGALQTVCQMMGDDNIPLDDRVFYHQQSLSRSNSLQVARLRARGIAHQISTRGLNSVLPQGLQYSTMPAWSHEPDPAQILDGEEPVSTSTYWEPAASHAYNQSKTALPFDQNTVHELVSPISPSTYHFSPLAPDDGIISPITAEREERRWYNEDPDREGVVGSQQTGVFFQRLTHSESTWQQAPSDEDVCTCNECTCDDWETQNVEGRSCVISPPPRSPLRVAPRITSLGSSARGYPADDNYPESQLMGWGGSLVPTGPARASQSYRPTFYLQPDIAGPDENGGLVGWAELLNIREKAKVRTNDASAARSDRHDVQPAEDDGNHDDDNGDGQGRTENMCTGSWNRHIDSEERPDELGAVVKVLSAPAPSITSAAAGSKKGRPRSKSKSTFKSSSSRLSLSLGLRGSKEKITNETAWRHVARHKGDRGGCVTASDFF
ncbi:uncharacterized protein Z520_04543 [Fonsecaea multimorphosa CBS 102226]|uniref:F-box domain-containing protein n=1 Tax=Fonsecaea multimorphosa CBS 102226 TaxID=1442371 RepID=A0A0D2ISH2_9EURO|nr:uncharacterized protein Z520_04543 [Fonsecaea multimorphosa CBS 102226]KIX99906.1 hypothetical protein Z520_04543 [Fonsecaea multimorphosa CBS 102226]